MRKTSSSLPDSYPGLSGSFFIDTSSSGRAGCHPVTDISNSRFFIQGPIGTGKTFLYKCLCYFYRAQRKIVLCMASSGIAALLLPGGRTAHLCFAILLNIHELSVCQISKNSQLADLIRQISLIIRDEVPMQHRYCFEAVN